MIARLAEASAVFLPIQIDAEPAAARDGAKRAAREPGSLGHGANVSDYIVEFNNISWETPARGVRVKSLIRGDKKLRLVEFTEEFIEPNWCTKGHIGMVLAGEMAVNINGVVQKFRAGDGLFIPSGEQSRHRHHATIKTAKLFLVEEA